jgi:DNA-binding transcriptional ArsR family regulator
LTAFDAKTAGAFLKSKKKEAGLINEDIKNLLDYRKTTIALEKAKESDIKISPDDKEKVIEILKRPSLLYDYGFIVQRLGVVGEDHNIRIILLSLTSSKLPGKRVASLIIKAESSSGKSYVLEKCLEVYPDEQYYEFTSLSDRALIYTDQDFKHKFIIFYEYSGIEDTETNKLIRTLQSENRLRYAVTIKVDGDFEVRHILKEGPTGCITTTTQPQLFDENETRVFSLYMDETEEQTKQICRDISGRFMLDRKLVSNEELQLWINIQRVLEPYHVHIPFAGWLAENIPTDKVRIRRDFERIMAFISASALLHQYQREIREKDGRKYVIASIADYLMARELLEATLVKTVAGSSPKTEKLVELIKEICAEKMEAISSEDKETDHCASMSDLIKRSGVSRRTVYYWIRPALNAGAVETVGGGKGKPTFYRPTDQAVKGLVRLDSLFLPQPEQIINAHPDLARGLKYVDPITGDEIIIEEENSSSEKAPF